MRNEDAFSKCHPLLNFFYFAMVLLFTMFVQHPVFLAISYLGAVCYAVWLNGLKRTLRTNVLFTFPMLLFVALLNPLFSHYGVTTLFYIESSGNPITLEALVYGLVLGAVLFVMIQWFACYNRVMTSDKFIYLFGRVIPSLSLILSMALRFVPRFQAQLHVIQNGQRTMGKEMDSGNVIKRAKSGLEMLSMLITWALENAIETSDSMQSRGYGEKGRTAFSIYRFTRRDRWLAALMAGLSLVFTYGCAKGAAFAQYNPRILLAGFVVLGQEAPIACSDALAAATFAAFAVFCFLPLCLGIAQEASMKKSLGKAAKDVSLTYRELYEEIEGGSADGQPKDKQWPR